MNKIVISIGSNGRCRESNVEQCLEFLRLRFSEARFSTACKLAGLVPIDLDIVMWNGEVVRQRDFNQDYFQIGWKQLHK